MKSLVSPMSHVTAPSANIPKFYVDVGSLEDFVVWYFSKPRIENEAKLKHVVVCVDEVRQLMNGTHNSVVLEVASALGKLAFGLEKQAVTCTVIVPALTDDTFSTVTGRPVHKIFLPLPCDAARGFIGGNLLPNASDHEKAMIAACAGTHLRSIVVACNYIAMKGCNRTSEGLQWSYARESALTSTR